MATEKLTITADGQGNYVCASADEADEPGDSVTVQSVADVVAWVQSELSEDDSAGPQAAWDAEAAKRGPDGRPQSGPSMSM